jgi:hypothetical protein
VVTTGCAGSAAGRRKLKATPDVLWMRSTRRSTDDATHLCCRRRRRGRGGGVLRQPEADPDVIRAVQQDLQDVDRAIISKDWVVRTANSTRSLSGCGALDSRTACPASSEQRY